MKRMQLILTMSLLFLPAISAIAQDRLIQKNTDPLEIRVWTNKAEGKSFGQGERIIVYFRANRDCFVTIYDVDTRGDVNLLFPSAPGDPFYIEGDRVYTIPDYYDDFELAISGPPGTEYIQAVASLDPFDVPNWPSRFLEYDDYYRLRMDRDPVDFLHYVNYRYFPLGGCGTRCATDVTSFEVRRDWSYDWDDYYSVTRVYHHHYYDPWDWCGTVYIGYPYGASIWINGVFYGYAPCFVPRIVVGWHHFRIWYLGSDWYCGRYHIYPGGWYDYTWHDVRYKDSPKHFGFKPQRRGSPEHVAEKYHQDRRKAVYTREAGYVSRSTYDEKYAKNYTRRSGPSITGSSTAKQGDGRTLSGNEKSVKAGEGSKTYKPGRSSSAWDEYNKPGATKSSGKSEDARRKEIKGFSGSKPSGASKPGTGTSKKSDGDVKVKSPETTKKPSGYSKPKDSGSGGGKSSGKEGSSGYSRPGGGSSKPSGSPAPKSSPGAGSGGSKGSSKPAGTKGGKG